MSNSSLQHKARRVKAARILAGLSRAQLQKRYGIPQHTVRNWEQEAPPPNYTGLTYQGAVRLTEVLRQEHVICDVAWLLEGVGAGPIFDDESDSFEQGWSAEANLQQDIDAFQTTHPQALVLLVPDDAMMPVYRFGDYVGGIPIADEAYPKIQNHDCFIRVDQQVLLRRVHYHPENEQFTLMPLHPAYSSTMYNQWDVQKVYEIIWVRRKPDIGEGRLESE